MRFHRIAFLAIFLLVPLSLASSWPNEKPSVKTAFIERVLGWMEDPEGGNGQFPTIHHFGDEPGQIALDDILEKWGRETSDTVIFNTPEQMYLELKSLAEQRGLRPRLLFVPLNTDPELRDELRQEAHELVLYWMMKNSSRVPTVLDFGKGPNQIPIDHMRLMGRGLYSPNQRYEHLALFQRDEQFWREHQKFAALRGVTLDLIEVSFSKPLSSSTQQIIKKEAIDRIVLWMLDPDLGDGRRPETADFQDEGGSIKVCFRRLTGRGRYARGAQWRHRRIFASRADYEFALTERLARIDQSLNDCNSFFPR